MERKWTQDAVDAAVFVDGVETPYTRMGSGPIALVLASDAAQRMELCRMLAGRFCVILPNTPGPPGNSDQAAGWISGFLDGLGADFAEVVTDAEWAVAVDALAASEPDRIRRVVQSLSGE